MKKESYISSIYRSIAILLAFTCCFGLASRVTIRNITTKNWRALNQYNNTTVTCQAIEEAVVNPVDENFSFYIAKSKRQLTELTSDNVQILADLNADNFQTTILYDKADPYGVLCTPISD
ncbi:hypothetical protein bpr_II010 (plasmid) [Butyrivibrio proteoclasticus B316]|uniref:Uncharacterized protein n=1 Tax=Butyrivibrio proteoclasticus (strain ATCC 51982 / DSM 14932 / B316) TaxID=515622 RepID=E0S3G9_BUTPB|nr:hypothetical protein [Butyrivibrio proteoclasticus]ADL35951.1 hypothetical protein bpr_II010 [Butyrivibrio proteoclasticus B316]